MRTSINLDDDVYEIASVYAAARKITLGAAIGELLKKSQSPSADAFPNIRMSPHGIPILSSRMGPITMERVKAAQEEEVD